MDEVFGDENYVSQITVRKTTSEGDSLLGSTADFIIWYARDKANAKGHAIYGLRSENAEGRYSSRTDDGAIYRLDNITSSRSAGAGDVQEFEWFNTRFTPGNGTFKTTSSGMTRLGKADRLQASGKGKLNYRRFQNDFGYAPLANIWTDIRGAVQSRSDPKIYVVHTSTSIIARCLLLTSDPGDLILDPTCGSGTTAYVAEQLGRRWITIDTSRVALALARARVMGARYPFYMLADSREGQIKEAQLQQRIPSDAPTQGDVRQGFVYERVSHITLKSIANNAEIDVIWQEYQEKMEPLRDKLNGALKERWQEWEIPRDDDKEWSKAAKQIHTDWWEQRISRQRAIDASISAKAEFEYLYDKPYEDNKKVRVAGPFTVESLSPHRVLAVDDDGEMIDPASSSEGDAEGRDAANFVQVILDNLKTSGVQQADKGDKIAFSSLTPWPGMRVCAEGRYLAADGTEKRAGIFIGPEFGTVSRPDLVSAAREAGDAAFDVLIACAFNYDAHSADFSKLGRIPVLKARMNADLHMSADLKNTGKGNLFVIFGEPDIEILPVAHDEIRVKVNGVDVFHPSTGEVTSSDPAEIACWFVDTDYNEESFFVRQAYFLGANDPYKALKTTLKAEINEDAWSTLHSDISRPFPKPESGRIAVKVINHLGDEVMKVFKVS